MSKLDSWEARVLLVLGGELPEEAPVVAKPTISNVSKPSTRNSDFLRRFTEASMNSVNRYLPSYNNRPKFIESSSVTAPAYRGKVITKEEGLPRQVIYNGRVYVRLSESLVWSPEDAKKCVYSEMFNATPEDFYGYIRDFPKEIGIAGEKYTLYREGQYDVVGFWINEIPSFLGVPARQVLKFTTYCSLCLSRVDCDFDIRKADMLAPITSGVQLLRGFMDELREKECPICKNTGNVTSSGG